jgi:hypothetical protein
MVRFYAMLIEKASAGARRGAIKPARVAPIQQFRKIHYQTVRSDRILAPHLLGLPLSGRKVDKKPSDLALEVGEPKQ